MDLLRREDETPLAYHKRLIQGKLIDHTLADVDYTELSELAYGKAYSSDVARRMFYGSCKTLQIMEDDALTKVGRSLLEELNEKKIELQKERQRYYDQRREYNKQIREDGRNEHLNERLVLAAENLKDEFIPVRDPVDQVNTGDRDAILVFADWHYGLDTSNIWNKYNTEIFAERLRNILDEAKERITLNRVENLHIIVLGDMIHGGIHTSARVASNELVCDQLMHASEYLARAIAELASYVSETHVYCTYGNHARTIPNKNDNIHRDNFERIIPWWLTERFKFYDGITVEPESDTEFIHFNVKGHGLCAAHGDLDSVKNSPRLLYTLFEKQFGERIEIVILGDKHHREQFEELGVTSIITSALCGSDDYANNKRLYSSAGQLMVTICEDGIDAVYHLRGDKTSP